MKFHRYLLKIRLPKRSRYSPFFDLILRQSTVNLWNTHCVSSLNTAGLRRSFRQDPSWMILRSVSSTNTWREMRNLLWSTFGHQLNGVRSVHQRSFLQLSHGPAYFMEPTQFLHHPYLSVGRFLFYVIQRNDLQQRLLFYTNGWNARSKQDCNFNLNCNLMSQNRGLCICSVISDATH